MSDRVTINAEPRSVVGKKVKQLRRDGWIPAIVYGQREPINIQLERGSLRRALRVAGTTRLIELALAGEQHTVLAREIQQHLTRGDLIHVDFLEVDMQATITSEAELVAVNRAAIADEGLGTTIMPLRFVDIECLPGNLVSEIEVDLSLIKTPDDVIYVSDIVAPEGVTILTDPEVVAVRFEYTQLEEEEEEEEEEFMPAADSVEVIGRGKDEEEFEE